MTIGAQAKANIKDRGGTAMEQDAQAQQAAMEQLKQSGLNDQQIQEMVNEGAVEQIVAQGDITKWITSKKFNLAVSLQFSVRKLPFEIHFWLILANFSQF